MPSAFVPAVTAAAPPSPRARWFVVTDGGLAVLPADGAPRLPTAEETAGLVDPASALYLGRLDDVDCWAAWAEAPLAGGLEARRLRDLWSVLDDDVFGVAGRAVQIVDWDRTHRFCGRCAAPTEPARDERARRCPVCGLTAYPRLAPAVITLVHRDDEVLLARGVGFPDGMYSVLAGFVEPGESLEDCVAREIREEVGVEVEDIRYFGSQPWPYPHSLMIGFTARWAAGELVPDAQEIADAGWFRADRLPAIPSAISISRRLIDAWLARQGAAVED